jgi:hypothetical protein
MLAGVSPEWYTWLEQGREINVSMHVLESLVRALQLDADERTHVFLLALRQPPPVETLSHTTISPTFQQFLNQLGTTPACLLDARLNVVAWNKAFCAVCGDYEAMSERERNLIWRIFTSSSLERNEQWEEHARLYLAHFRAGYDRFLEDPWWAQYITELNRLSPEFREWWARHEVLTVAEGRKVTHHPLVGELAFEFLFFQTVDSSDLRLLIHTPRSNSGTADKIERLLASEEE